MKRADWLAGRPQPELYRILELLVICFVWTTLSFVLPLMLPVACTEKPEGGEDDYEPAVGSLVDDLVQFQCSDGHYNQLASLTLVNSDVTLQQLFHFHYSDGSNGSTFDWYVLILFFLFYFAMAIVAAGHSVQQPLRAHTGSCIYRPPLRSLSECHCIWLCRSLHLRSVGVAAVLGGMSRMTICGVVIMLEASGNNEFLLP